MSKRDYNDVGLLHDAERNLNVVRKAYRSADAGDFENFFADFAPDAIAYEAEGLPYGGVFEGKEGCIRLNTSMFRSWESVAWKVLQLAAGGDLVFVHLEMTFKPQGGEAIKHPVAELWRFRHGKIIEIRPFYYDTKLIRDVLAGKSA